MAAWFMERPHTMKIDSFLAMTQILGSNKSIQLKKSNANPKHESKTKVLYSI